MIHVLFVPYVKFSYIRKISFNSFHYFQCDKCVQLRNLQFLLIKLKQSQSLFRYFRSGLKGFAPFLLVFLDCLVIITSVKYVINLIIFVGNTLTIIIMKRKEFRETFHKLLIALAVFDNVFILSALFTLIIRYVLYVE